MKLRTRVPGTFAIIIGVIMWLLTYYAYDALWYIFMVLIGIILICYGIVYLKLAQALTEDNRRNLIVRSVTLIVVGALLIIPWTNGIIVMVISIVVGVTLLVLCLIKLLSSADKWKQFKKDLYKYIICGLVIAFGINGVGRIIALVFSSLIIIYGIILVIFECIAINKKNHNSTKPKNPNEIEGTDYYVEDNKDEI
ncbi:MAG: hypothetical protein SOZ32_02040 [Bacilli bacterium]|nr:hypothetical protein [Mollicutes bacterium]MDY3898983.1 hypothetical protein [Bacilli bacterium]